MSKPHRMIAQRPARLQARLKCPIQKPIPRIAKEAKTLVCAKQKNTIWSSITTYKEPLTQNAHRVIPWRDKLPSINMWHHWMTINMWHYWMIIAPISFKFLWNSLDSSYISIDDVLRLFLLCLLHIVLFLLIYHYPRDHLHDCAGVFGQQTCTQHLMLFWHCIRFHCVSENILNTSNVWKVSKYGVISGLYFPVFNPNTGKYGLEITPYLDTFHAVVLPLFNISFLIQSNSSFLNFLPSLRWLAWSK